MNGLAQRSVAGRFALGDHSATRQARPPAGAPVALFVVPMLVALVATYCDLSHQGAAGGRSPSPI